MKEIQIFKKFGTKLDFQKTIGTKLDWWKAIETKLDWQEVIRTKLDLIKREECSIYKNKFIQKEKAVNIFCLNELLNNCNIKFIKTKEESYLKIIIG